MNKKMCMIIKQTANFVTVSRIAASVLMLFTKVFSVTFYILYMLCGITDMLDGVIARKTKTASIFGEKLDSIADFVFVSVCLVKLLPVLNIHRWLWIWTAIIAMIKLLNVAYGYIREHRLVTFHTVANRLTGFILFLLPMTKQFVNINYAAIPVCIIATFAALQEWNCLIKGSE